MEPLNIQISDLTLDTVMGAGYDGALTLADLIVGAAVKRLTKDDEYGEVVGGLRKRVAQIRDEEIRARVLAEIEATMAAPVSLTNSYGEPVGKATTIRELIVAEATKFFTEKKSTDNYDRGPRLTGAERVIAELVKAELTKEMATAFAEEKAKVVAAVQAKAAEMLAEAVRAGLR